MQTTDATDRALGTGQAHGAGPAHGEACERPDWLPFAGGAALALIALSKRSTLGVAAALGGTYLLYRAAKKEMYPGVLDRQTLDALNRRARDAADRLSEQARTLADQARVAAGDLGERARAAAGQIKDRAVGAPYDADLVDEASMESFPASDPPSYMSTPRLRKDAAGR